MAALDIPRMRGGRGADEERRAGEGRVLQGSPNEFVMRWLTVVTLSIRVDTGALAFLRAVLTTSLTSNEAFLGTPTELFCVSDVAGETTSAEQVELRTEFECRLRAGDDVSSCPEEMRLRNTWIDLTQLFRQEESMARIWKSYVDDEWAQVVEMLRAGGDPVHSSLQRSKPCNYWVSGSSVADGNVSNLTRTTTPVPDWAVGDLLVDIRLRDLQLRCGDDVQDFCNVLMRDVFAEHEAVVWNAEMDRDATDQTQAVRTGTPMAVMLCILCSISVCFGKKCMKWCNKCTSRRVDAPAPVSKRDFSIRRDEEGPSNAETGEACTICLTDFGGAELCAKPPCNRHRMHWRCWQTWVNTRAEKSQRPECPLCRIHSPPEDVRKVTYYPGLKGTEGEEDEEEADDEPQSFRHGGHRSVSAQRAQQRSQQNYAAGSCPGASPERPPRPAPPPKTTAGSGAGAAAASVATDASPTLARGGVAPPARPGTSAGASPAAPASIGRRGSRVSGDDSSDEDTVPRPKRAPAHRRSAGAPPRRPSRK